MRFYVGQIPTASLLVTVERDGSLIDLGSYDEAELLLTSPIGEAIDTGSGVIATTGTELRYSWPIVTLFPSPGDYRLRLKLYKGAGLEWTEPVTIEVGRQR